MNAERKNILAIVVLSTALVAAATYLGYTGSYRALLITPIPFVLIIMFAAHSMRSLATASGMATGHAKGIIEGMKASLLFVFLYVIARILLAIIAPSMSNGLLYAVIVGPQIGLLTSFFYVLSTTSHVIQQRPLGVGGPTGKHRHAKQLVLHLTPHFAASLAGSFGLLYILKPTFPSTVTVVVAALGVIVLSVFWKARKDHNSCRRLLEEADRAVMDRMYLANAMVAAVTVLSTVQEILFPRVAKDITAVLVVGAVLMASLVLTFLTMYAVIGQFKYSAIDVEAGDRGYRQKLI
ncbi:MAG: hypothetical protein HY366_01280 [Candidatus Aenigmarchaeota archaeon]|nr:hypothetical protein [Candidatus Aenigmarchaeota archaeon]